MKARELHSTLTSDGNIRLSIDEIDLGDTLGPDEEIVRVDAAPVNPTDTYLLLSMADLSKATTSGGALVAPVPPGVMKVFAARIDKPLPVGSEGAGTVIAAARVQPRKRSSARLSPPMAQCSRRIARSPWPACASCPRGEPPRRVRRRS